ncbi:mechanosensitive ion channel domain-containing protein [Wolinella succinogenes]|uniref:mechanosensitive ion channel domain-containing protein n=1 Tax=Wolinella succinogenes TaxID=844 RepID=UPI002409F03C|nr:mechanosensitive ion channel domain-containing protein [Wolinella succinogenes]
MRLIFSLIFLFLSTLALHAEEVGTPLKADQMRENLKEINRFLEDSNNIWMKKYANFRAYRNIVAEIESVKERLSLFQKRSKTLANQNEVATLERRLETLEKQRELMQEYKDNPFKELIQPLERGEVASVTNPILIIQAFSHIRQSKQELETLERNFESLKKVVESLKTKEALLYELVVLEGIEEEVMEYKETQNALGELESTQNIFSTTLGLYRKKVEEQTQRLTEQIKAQAVKAVYIGVAVLLLFVLALLMKMGIKKYIHDNERIYTANKIINFANLTLIIFILLFAYLENVTYLVTVLGFASAGLAIAMKDLFMSVLGWIVIVIGGAVHVGDRIRVTKDGSTYIGDVLDISILRITMHEGITLTTYMENRRAGRIIFIPNNYIFTTMFANYTHSGMKTVWDGIDFTITFESNHRKMVQIALDITKKYAKGYTEITRKQLNRLRDRYSLRNTNVEPRAFTMLEPNGIRISIWYQTNAYAALTLRSTISGEIVDALLAEPDIEIAYPTTTVRAPKEPLPSSDGAIPPVHL